MSDLREAIWHAIDDAPLDRHGFSDPAAQTDAAVAVFEAYLREHARHLAQISVQLREAGDIPLVLLGDDGVGPAGVTLADELWLIAFQLDADAANAAIREAGRIE